MFLRAEDRSKAQVILSGDDQLSLTFYTEHLPATCLIMGFLCTGGVEVVKTV